MIIFLFVFKLVEIFVVDWFFVFVVEIVVKVYLLIVGILVVRFCVVFL